MSRGLRWRQCASDGSVLRKVVCVLVHTWTTLIASRLPRRVSTATKTFAHSQAPVAFSPHIHLQIPYARARKNLAEVTSPHNGCALEGRLCPGCVRMWCPPHNTPHTHTRQTNSINACPSGRRHAVLLLLVVVCPASYVPPRRLLSRHRTRVSASCHFRSFAPPAGPLWFGSHLAGIHLFPGINSCLNRSVPMF